MGEPAKLFRIDDLEGSTGIDKLVGDGNANNLLGRLSSDELLGQAGGDNLESAEYGVKRHGQRGDANDLAGRHVPL